MAKVVLLLSLAAFAVLLPQPGLWAASSPASCPVNFSVQSISLTDWEAGLGLWTVGTYDLAQPEAFDTPDWAAVGGLPDSRTGKAAFVANLDVGSCPGDDQSGVLTLTSPSIEIPVDANGPRIAFNHWFDIEDLWDGGNLKISVDGGDFKLVPGSAFETGPYTDVLNEAIRDTLPYNHNPLAEQEAFTGPGLQLGGGSWGLSRVNLAGIAAAGDSIQLRFDFGVDECFGWVGWYVDDVEFYSCEAELDKIDQTITGLAADPAAGVVDGTSALSATASSGLAVTFGSSTGAVCTVAGSIVTYLTAGTCTVTANQAGDVDYNAATQVTTNITVAKADQTISGLAADPAAGVVDGSSALSATASSGLAVTFGSSTGAVCTVAGRTVTYLTAGTCTVTANQAGDDDYNAASQVTTNITVTKADQTITGLAADPATGTFDGSSALSATASSGLAVTFGSSTPAICTVAGSTVTYLIDGTCTVTANQAGDDDYNAAPQVTTDIAVIIFGDGFES